MDDDSMEIMLRGFMKCKKGEEKEMSYTCDLVRCKSGYMLVNW